ncbi:L-asparaginase 1-like isoform X2 [Drosophila tropicalis]
MLSQSNLNLPGITQNVSKVLTIYTGGTIGMTLNENGVLAPVPGQFEPRIREDMNFHDPTYLPQEPEWLVLPSLGDEKRVLYKIKEYDPLLDSSNMERSDWKRIAQDINDEYKNYDGFVVLHGTDTLAFTSSALSFMLQNLGKPVMVTGSQIPIYQTRSDGKDNFVASLIVAGTYDIPEVCVVFNHKLLRGNRTVKVNCEALDAFNSPNYPPLATMGVSINLNEIYINRPPLIEPFSVQLSMDANVSLLRITPGMTLNQISGALSASVRGVVLQSFGAGNIPSNRDDLLTELKAAIARGVIIVNCTQCLGGSVADAYDASSEIFEMGVIFLGDITMEAAYTKLSYVLSKHAWSLQDKKDMMKTSLRGELTVKSAKLNTANRLGNVIVMEKILIQNSSVVNSAIEEAISFDQTKVIELLLKHGAQLTRPPLEVAESLCAAAARGSVKRLQSYQTAGVDLSLPDSSGRTALHMAALHNSVDVVKFLLNHVDDINQRDILGLTPLEYALRNQSTEVIMILNQAAKS